MFVSDIGTEYTRPEAIGLLRGRSKWNNMWLSKPEISRLLDAVGDNDEAIAAIDAYERWVADRQAWLDRCGTKRTCACGAIAYAVFPSRFVCENCGAP